MASVADQRPARPLLLFAPGAGAPATSAWMEAWAARLATIGEVVRFDYPYRLAGRRAPDRLPVLVEAHRAALAAARARARGAPAVLVGKSMGSRVGCHLAAAGEAGIAGLVCFGYPLLGASGGARGGACPRASGGPGGAGRIGPPVRDEVLCALRTPVLFVQGTRDRLCPLDRLEAVRARMAAPSALHVVEGGDHSLEVGVRALAARGETQEDVDRAILGQVAAFVAGRGRRG